MGQQDYRFLDKNPVIDLIRTAYLDSNLRVPDIAKSARIAVGTMDNWLYGKTINPQTRTVGAVMRVLGIEVQYIYVATGERLTARAGVARKFTKKPKLRSVRGGQDSGTQLRSQERSRQPAA